MKTNVRYQTLAREEISDEKWIPKQVIDSKDGERGRNRTYNLLIKSQLLCQLSYAPVLPHSRDFWQQSAAGHEREAPYIYTMRKYPVSSA